MDDFVRNFMVRMGLTGTLEKFETEWYEMEATGKLNKEDMGAVPDVYNYNQELNDQCVALRREVNVAVEPVQTVDSALESGEKTAVQVFTPMGRQNGVGCCLGGDAMGEVVHLGVRDVPSLMDG